MIKINFDETYPLDWVAEDFSIARFTSQGRNGEVHQLTIQITSVKNPFLPNVVHLAFGPLDKEGQIDDHARIHHVSSGKVFSTILLFAYTYLTEHSELTIGVDGSNDSRAYLYHSMFQLNRQHLSNYFVALGVDWYVRLLRNGDIERNPEGLPFFKPQTVAFDYERSKTDLYSYYLFRLKR